nr:hypothetical protein [Tanacetum cinerariifolium]
MRLVKHGLEEYAFEHGREDELVVVMVKVVHECRHWMDLCVNQEWWRCCEVDESFDLLVDYRMVVKEIEYELLEEMEESLDDGLSKTLMVGMKMIMRISC